MFAQLLRQLAQQPEPGCPAVVVELMRELDERMDDLGWPSAPAPTVDAGPLPAAPPASDHGNPPVPASEAPPPQRIAVKPDPQQPGRALVTAKDAHSQRGARTIQQLLDAMAGWPIAPLSDVLMEAAVHAEALELENQQLRAMLAAAQPHTGVTPT